MRRKNINTRQPKARRADSVAGGTLLVLHYSQVDQFLGVSL